MLGRTVLDFLCVRFRYHARDLWEDRIAAGRIRVNGTVAGAGAVLATGDDVEYTVVILEPHVDFDYEVVWSDNDLLVVSKSGDIPVHASGNYIKHTLIARLRDDLGPDLNLAHRLDRETSGLVVLTRNADAARGVARAFAERRVGKEYLAVVRGHPTADRFGIDVPLGRIGKQHPVPRAIVDRRRGKPARTAVRVVERMRGVSIVTATPQTGRTNQVRAHLEYAGHPVVGDKVYGVPARLLGAILADPRSEPSRSHLLLARHALHCARLEFDHPRSGERLRLEARLPEDIAGFIESQRGT